MKTRVTGKHVELHKNDELTITLYVDAGGNELSPVTLTIIAPDGSVGCRGLLTVMKVRETNPDGQEYFITKDGLVESPML